MTANFIGYSNYTSIAISKSIAFVGEIKGWEYNSITVFSWIFSIIIRIAFVVEVGSRVRGNAFFKCGNIFLGKVDVY